MRSCTTSIATRQKLQLSSCRKTSRNTTCVRQRRTTLCGAIPAGPPPPPKKKPEWLRIMEQDADWDEDVKRVMEGTGGDEDKIREKMRAALSDRHRWMINEREGSDEVPRIRFREVDVFNLWVWIQFSTSPGDKVRDLLQNCLRSWYIVAKMGGYNSANMQLANDGGVDYSYFEYSTQGLDGSMNSFLHEMSEAEYKGRWARFRLDMGTCDELALDVLINTLVGFSREFAGINMIYVGGANDDWEVPNDADSDLAQARIDPMRLPEGVDDELEMLDDLLSNKSSSSRSSGRGF